jgi:hypothetical protein
MTKTLESILFDLVDACYPSKGLEWANEMNARINNLNKLPAASPASPVREALEKINEIFEAPDYGDSVIKRYNDIKKIVLAARTEGEGWTKVEDGLPELDESVNIAYWIQPAKGNGFWVVEVGYLQAITKRKTADGEKEYGEWKHGDQWNSSTPQYWARYRPLPSPPKTT